MIKKRILSMMLIIVMVLTIIPSTALAINTDVLDEDVQNNVSTYAVNVYTTVNDLTFFDSDGQAVNATTTSEDSYTVYEMNLDSGTYTYQAADYGSGVIKVTKSEDIYLRVIDYTFYEGGSDFHMEVTRPDDEELVYTSPVSKTKSTKLLVPALGWGVNYRYNFVPEDDTYCPFSGALWAHKGLNEFVGFKSESFNLSDSGSYIMGKKQNINFKIPKGANLEVSNLVKFYCPCIEFETTKTDTEDNYDIYTATISNPYGGNYFYKVSMPGYMTTAETFNPSGSIITVDSLTENPHQQIKQSKEASIISNGNCAKYISLSEGESFSIWTSRAWQAIDGICSNRYVEPDKHYIVLDGEEVVTVDEKGIVHAEKEGTAIVAITYDALQYNEEMYSAIRPENISVFVFTVGANKDGLTTGLENRFSDLDTFYYPKTVNVVGEGQVSSSDHTTLTFTPPTTNDQQLNISVATVHGYPTPTITEWKDCPIKTDGSVSVNLYEGRNVIKVTSGDLVDFNVLQCKGTDIKVSNSSNPGVALKVGEKVHVSYTNIMSPQPKLGAIYNPGFGGTQGLKGVLDNTSNDEDGQIIHGSGKQYDMASGSWLEGELGSHGNYILSDVHIPISAFGSASTAHLGLSIQSEGGDYDGGDAPLNVGRYSYLPDVSFNVSEANYQEAVAVIINLINDIGTVSYDETSHGKITAARTAYNSSSSVVQELIRSDYPEQFKILTDAEKAYVTLDEAEIAKKINKTTEQGIEYYILTNGEQLKWFAKLVNGTLADGSKEAGANAVLANDIIVNEGILGEDYSCVAPRFTPQWTPIGTEDSAYNGIFDGAGYVIKGLYQVTDNLIGAMFGNNTGTIKDLTVEDSYFYSIRTDAVSYTEYVRLSGIASLNSGLIQNVIFDGYVGGSNQSNCAGIVSYNESDGVVQGCISRGKIEAIEKAGGIAVYNYGKINRCICIGSVSSSKTWAGGIISQNIGVVENCYSSAIVSGSEKVAGIAANTVGEINSCYNIGKVICTDKYSAGIANWDNGKATFNRPSYYLIGSAKDGLDLESKIIGKSDAQFTSGEVAYLLGEAFGQMIGKDQFPVFINDYNKVFQVEDDYVNSDYGILISVINEIGKVSLDGNNNCFSKVTEAREAYNNLSSEDKAKISNIDVLEAKEASYTVVVDKLNADLIALLPVNENSYSAINAVRSDYQKYILLGGNKNLITNYPKLAEAETAYIPVSEEKICDNIETRTINDKEYYVLTNVEEMYWFAKLVNGTLQSAEETKPDVNAILGADITVNKDLLNDLLDNNGVLIEQIGAFKTTWIPIKNFSGTFDGDGHAISGIYINNGIETGACSIFDLVTGTIKNLKVDDIYLQGWTNVGMVGNLKNGGKIDQCSTNGKFIASMWVGGIVCNIDKEALVSNCYNMASVDSLFDNIGRSGGIAGNNSGVVENCYNSGTITGGQYSGGIIGSYNSGAIKNCYYLDSSSSIGIGVDQDGVNLGETFSYTKLQTTNGELCYKLGTAFGQNLEEDTSPVFFDGTNHVYLVSGEYKNNSVDTTKTLISSIGTVALDGKANCFESIDRARDSYNCLSETDQGKVTNLTLLTRCEAIYKAIVEKLIKDIEDIVPDNPEGLEKFYQLEKDYADYLERGGDSTLITNLNKINLLKAEIEENLILWEQQKIEETIAKKDIDDKSYYVINNLSELKWFTHLVNGTLKTETPQNASASAILATDIVVNEDLLATVEESTDEELLNDWIQIGSAKCPYSGTFDGAGHTISGVFSYKNKNFTGVFGQVSGKVKNLGVYDSYLRADNTTNCGGIAGQVNEGGVIENCKFKGVVVAKTNAGGITAVNNGTISMCSIDGTVDIAGTLMMTYAGGIAGTNSSIIENCYIAGKLSASSTGRYGSVGGIAGKMKSGTIKNCYSICEIISPKIVYLRGGIIGNNFADITEIILTNNYYISTIPYGIGGTDEEEVVDSIIEIDQDGKKTIRIERKDTVAFGDGTVANLLGEAYTQRVGIDPYPIFAVNIEEADEVVALITSIGTVTEDSKTAIEEAREAYNKLSFNQKDLIINYSVLKAAEVDEVVALITAIGTVTKDSKTAIETARTLYNELSFNQKDLVTNYSVLETAEKTYADIILPKPKKYKTVTFRLIGSTLSKDDVDLGGSGYNGAEYQNWIKTKSYTYNSDETVTVYDVFMKAIDRAGLEQKGADFNYVSTITAPSSLGGYKLSEFTNGKYSGWMYTVNGSHPNVGLKYKTLKNGDKIVWHYVNDYRYEVEDWFDDPKYPALGDESTWNKWLLVPDGKSKNTKPALTETIKPKVSISNLEAKAKVTTIQTKEAIEAAKKNHSSEIIIAPEIKHEAESIAIVIPKTSVDNLAEDTNMAIAIKTAIGNINISNEALTKISDESGSNVEVNIKKADTKELSDEIKEIVGDRPVFDLSVSVGSKKVTDFGKGKVSVSIPYTPKEGEDTSKIIIYYIDVDGKAIEMEGSYYDAKEKCVVFETNHFSKFAIGYNENKATIQFIDLTDNHWAKDYIYFLANKGIINGKTENTFSPQDNITRAEFATILYRISGDKVTSYVGSFDDVEENAWYANSVEWAVKSSVSKGISEKTFAPNNNITREQMATMIIRFADYMKFKLLEKNDEIIFVDSLNISDYAKVAVSSMQKAGIINGKDNNMFVPADNATRAEAAKMLAMLMQEMSK